MAVPRSPCAWNRRSPEAITVSRACVVVVVAHIQRRRTALADQVLRSGAPATELDL